MTFIKPKKYKLNNGLEVVLINLKNFDSVIVSYHINVGSKYESKKLSGISHFLEHLSFQLK